MSISKSDSLVNVLTTGTIIAIVISVIIGLAICIGLAVILVCLIKHCSKSNVVAVEGVVLEPYSYPQSWTTQYPPNLTSVSHYPPPYQSLPPPYTASTAGPYKSFQT